MCATFVPLIPAGGTTQVIQQVIYFAGPYGECRHSNKEELPPLKHVIASLHL